MKAIISTASLFGCSILLAAKAAPTYTTQQIQDALIKHLKEIPAPVWPPLPDPVEWEDANISGQCFIATKGGENFKLGLVTVFIFDPETDKTMEIYAANYRGLVLQGEVLIQDSENKRLNSETANIMAGKGLDPNSESKTNDAIAAIQVDSELEYKGYDIGAKPLFSTKTDADGKFTLSKLPKGDFVLFALASRKVFDKTEHYVWSLKAKDVRGQKQLFLSNDNHK